MTATYTNLPGTVPVDTVRFLVDDRDTIPATDAALSDEEIQYFLDQANHVLLAAADAAEAIATKYAGDPKSKQVGDLEISYGDTGRAATYKELAASLRSRARRKVGASIYAGGISLADKKANDADTDRVDPVFTVGMHDNVAVDELIS